MRQHEENATLANEEFHQGHVKGDIRLTTHRAFAQCAVYAHICNI
jgi:hypothetical protein